MLKLNRPNVLPIERPSILQPLFLSLVLPPNSRTIANQRAERYFATARMKFQASIRLAKVSVITGIKAVIGPSKLHFA